MRRCMVYTSTLEVQSQLLQKMFNIASVILTLTPQSCDIETVLLEKLHWLSVPKHIQYKILLLTFKALHIIAPQYLPELPKPQVTEHTTRQTYTNSQADTNRLHKLVNQNLTTERSLQ